jgi:quercetin dioxygenase-like cupin family protein
MKAARFVFPWLAALGVLGCALWHPSVRADDRPIRPEVLIESEIAGVPGKLLRVIRTTYLPGAINPKHYHTSHVAFYILEGSGVWQEEGQPPVTLKPGDSLLVKPGTVHAHWNASTTERLTFTEFVIVDQGQRSTIRMP